MSTLGQEVTIRLIITQLGRASDAKTIADLDSHLKLANEGIEVLRKSCIEEIKKRVY